MDGAVFYNCPEKKFEKMDGECHAYWATGTAGVRGAAPQAAWVGKLRDRLAFWKLISPRDAYCEQGCRFLELPSGFQRIKP